VTSCYRRDPNEATPTRRLLSLQRAGCDDKCVWAVCGRAAPLLQHKGMRQHRSAIASTQGHVATPQHHHCNTRAWGNTSTPSLQHKGMGQHRNTITATQGHGATPSLQHKGMWQHHHCNTRACGNTITATQGHVATPSLQHKGLWQHHHCNTRAWGNTITATQGHVATPSLQRTRLFATTITRYTATHGMRLLSGGKVWGVLSPAREHLQCLSLLC
jgi:hypothetical protein